ncbi:MAG: glutamine synthetase III [Clostridia bacterium]|nr:glutamine synthetase III [Clostridia bacterium]
MAKKTVSEYFGEQVFNDAVMKERLPESVYNSLQKTIREGAHIENDVASVVAEAMKDWAIEKGATHYTHWFQPMTGITAEKHDAFIVPADGGRVIMEFHAKELIKGESDASSFPSGGLRATFEARGYTVWDPTSYAFVRDGTLYIPTAFCSYSGEALDMKTPLMRSNEAINREALRVLKFFDDDAPKRVYATVGAEQEYFLVDKRSFMARKDLRFTGRTLFGAKPPKGQELEDHYFGNIKERVAAFMKEVDVELWRLGVYAKTKHNEVAPAQHELAPVFSLSTVAADHNQLIMDVLKKVAERQDLVCLLHEKPFAEINGSGKHNNWSLNTDTGVRIFKPGKTPEKNYKFLLFVAAIIKAVDKYADILKASVSTAANDQRLGGNEAPPSIISIYLGNYLEAIFEAISKGDNFEHVSSTYLGTGVESIPLFKRDTFDRNRTSPFAYTGNKFEFRMGGSSQSVSGSIAVINTIVADALSDFADRLEKAEDPEAEKIALIRDSYNEHKRVVFNSNNYSEEWLNEAEARGLQNLKNSVESYNAYINPKNIALFEKHKIFTEAELHARYEIYLDIYSKTVKIEALTMLDMAKKEILPAVLKYENKLLDNLNMKMKAYVSNSIDTKRFTDYDMLYCEAVNAVSELENCLSAADGISEVYEKATFYSENILNAMKNLRTVCDKLETLTDEKAWPFPTYSELLFNV